MSEMSSLTVVIELAFAEEIDEERLRRLAAHVLRAERVAPGVEASLVITDDERVRELNRRYRGVDAFTDVLAFSASEAAPGFVVAPEEAEYLGDVLISYPRAVAQATEQGHPVAEELDLLVVHGLLHLLGYDDETEEQRAEMWQRQRELLSH